MCRFGTGWAYRLGIFDRVDTTCSLSINRHTSYREGSLLIQRMAATAPKNSEPKEEGCGEDRHRTLVVPSGRKAVTAAAWPESPEEPSEERHTHCRPGAGGLVSASAAPWHPHSSRDFFSRQCCACRAKRWPFWLIPSACPLCGGAGDSRMVS